MEGRLSRHYLILIADPYHANDFLYQVVLTSQDTIRSIEHFPSTHEVKNSIRKKSFNRCVCIFDISVLMLGTNNARIRFSYFFLYRITPRVVDIFIRRSSRLF